MAYVLFASFCSLSNKQLSKENPMEIFFLAYQKPQKSVWVWAPTGCLLCMDGCQPRASDGREWWHRSGCPVTPYPCRLLWQSLLPWFVVFFPRSKVVMVVLLLLLWGRHGCRRYFSQTSKGSFTPVYCVLANFHLKVTETIVVFDWNFLRARFTVLYWAFVFSSLLWCSKYRNIVYKCRICMVSKVSKILEYFI